MTNERTKCPTCASVVEIGGKPESTRYFIPVVDDEIQRLRNLHHEIFEVYAGMETQQDLETVNRALMEIVRLAAQGKVR